MKRVLNKNKEMEAQKIIVYNEKQAMIQKRKDELKEVLEEEKRQKEEKINERHKRIESAQRLNEKQEEMKKSKIIEKISTNQERVYF